LLGLLLLALPAWGDPWSRIAVLEDRRQAGPELVALVRAANPLVRQRAVVALGRIQNPATLPVLVAATHDPRLRQDAWFAIGQMWNPIAVPALLQGWQTERDPASRKLILEGLGKCANGEAMRVLSKACDNPTASMAIGNALLWASREHRKLPVPSDTAQRLQELIEDHNVEVRRGAAYALYRMKVFAPTLGDDDWWVRDLGARSAGAAKEKAAWFQLIYLLQNDRSWNVSVAAAQALGQLQIPDSRASLQKAIHNKNMHVARASLQAMGAWVGPPTWQLSDLPAELKPDGVVAWARMTKSLPTIDPSSWRIRKAVATAESDLQQHDVLERLLSDSDGRVRAEAVSALEHADPTWSEPLLLKALDDADDVVATQAADTLAERKDAAALPGIVRWIGQLQGRDRGESLVDLVGDLARLHGDAEVVRPCLSDADPEVRKAAAKVLGVKIAPGYAKATPMAVRGSTRLAMVHTNRGDFRIELFGADAPNTVTSFTRLSDRGFFNGLTFHRVVPDFVVQGGDPRGDGSGGPGYEIRCEINQHHYGRGSIGMALAGKDTGGSQWFVTHSPQPHLDGRYTCFGQVVDGMKVVDTLQEGDQIISITR
jgi:cyclophilin family peptidyl-prolyl cis-trans isomerase/HEAT repeat protein